jgi:tRNA1Val (adenine37-N6)-methyltransferase
VVTTDGHLLGGRLKYRQPASGFRTGIEPVLLAAAIPARSGEFILEAGTGAGAALLCASSRVPGAFGTGVEIDPAMADLARINACDNGLAGVEIVTAAIETVALTRQFDHAMANPPYHLQDGSASPVADRDIAKRGSDALMFGWIKALSRQLKHRGTLTLIVPAGILPVCLAAMDDCQCRATTLFPLWPKVGRSAKLVLLRGVRNSRSPMRVMPGLILHQPDGSFTDTAQGILSGGAVLSLD